MHELLALFDEQVRRRPSWDSVEHADRVIRLLHPAWRGILWSDLDGATADAVIEREIERFEGLGEWEWKHYSYDEPADLPDRLRAAGFEPEETEALLIATVADLPGASPLPDGVELREVLDEAGAAAMSRAHLEGFGDVNEALEREVLEEIRSGRTRAVEAYAGERPISAGRPSPTGDGVASSGPSSRSAPPGPRRPATATCRPTPRTTAGRSSSGSGSSLSARRRRSSTPEVVSWLLSAINPRSQWHQFPPCSSSGTTAVDT